MRIEQQELKAERLKRRKEQKMARKARGAKQTSSSESASSDVTDAGTTSLSSSSESSPPSTPPPGSVSPPPMENGTELDSCTSTTLGYRKVARRPLQSMADSRVRGADLYVVRLLQDTDSKAKAKEQRRRQRGTTMSTNTIPPTTNVMPRYADSRPCWRCLEWMYWAGIKRVFWTDTEGAWHGDKVTALLFGSALANNTATMYVPVHLTQYEHAAALLRQRQAK